MPPKAVAQRLVQEGLDLYGQGQFDDALVRWRDALKHDPGSDLASQYIAYVEANRSALEQTFVRAKQSQSTSNESASSVATPVQSKTARFEPATPEPTRRRVASSEMLQSIDWEAVRGSGVHPRVEGGIKRPPPIPSDVTGGLSDEDLTPRIDLVETAAIAEGRYGDATKYGDAAKSHSRDNTSRDWDKEPTVTSSSPVPTNAIDFDTPESTTGQLVISEAGQQEVDDFDITESGDDDMPHIGYASKEEREESSGYEEFSREGETTARILAARAERNEPEQDFGAFNVRSDELTSQRGRADDVTPPMGHHRIDGKRKRDSSYDRILDRSTRPPERKGEDPIENMLRGAEQLFQQGTYEGSLWLCERVLAAEQSNAAAKALREKNQDVLMEQYNERLSDLDQIPIICMAQEEILWHKLDHRAGFLLSRVDGVLTFNDILDISGMNRFETFRILTQLLDEGVIVAS